LIIPMIIQTIGLDPSRAVWTESASSLTSLDPSGAIQIDAEHPSRNRKVVDFFGIDGTNDRPAWTGPPGTRKEFVQLPGLASPRHRGETAAMTDPMTSTEERWLGPGRRRDQHGQLPGHAGHKMLPNR